MRFGGLTERGFGMMAVAGSSFDPALLPAPSAIHFRYEDTLAKAAIEAVRRTRLVSYVERGIIPGSALREPNKYRDARDEHCVHIILHRGNCLLGAIRCQFHRKSPGAADPIPLFREMMERSELSEADILHSQQLMESGTDTSHTFCETSGWLTNPDLRKSTSLGMLLPAAVWGLGSSLSEYHGISTLRASNKAAAVLTHLGGEIIRNEGRELCFDDPFYRGPVQLMRMHSRLYHPDIAHTVQTCGEKIRESGITIAV